MKKKQTPLVVNTSVWIDHFRSFDAHLVDLLAERRAWMHAGILGELACGNLANRASTITDLQDLPRVRHASDAEALHFIEAEQLMGRGIGYIDMQILASAKINHLPIWTRDKRMAQAAADLKMSYFPPLATRPN